MKKIQIAIKKAAILKYRVQIPSFICALLICTQLLTPVAAIEQETAFTNVPYTDFAYCYYGSQLSGLSAKIYEKLKKDCIDGSVTGISLNFDYNGFGRLSNSKQWSVIGSLEHKAVQAFFMDYTLFPASTYNTTWTCSGDSVTLSIKIQAPIKGAYSTWKEAEPVVLQWKKDIDSSLNGSQDRVEIIRKISHKIDDELTYSFSGDELVTEDAGTTDEQVHAAYYVLLSKNHYAVCEAYAKLTKLLCDLYGIPSIYIAGEDHAWNYIQLEDGRWYQVDTTWDDLGNSYGGSVLTGSLNLDDTHDIHMTDALYAKFPIPELAECYYLDGGPEAAVDGSTLTVQPEDSSIMSIWLFPYITDEKLETVRFPLNDGKYSIDIQAKPLRELFMGMTTDELTSFLPRNGFDFEIQPRIFKSFNTAKSNDFINYFDINNCSSEQLLMDATVCVDVSKFRGDSLYLYNKKDGSEKELHVQSDGTVSFPIQSAVENGPYLLSESHAWTYMVDYTISTENNLSFTSGLVFMGRKDYQWLDIQKCASDFNGKMNLDCTNMGQSVYLYSTNNNHYDNAVKYAVGSDGSVELSNMCQGKYLITKMSPQELKYAEKMVWIKMLVIFSIAVFALAIVVIIVHRIVKKNVQKKEPRLDLQEPERIEECLNENILNPENQTVRSDSSEN